MIERFATMRRPQVSEVLARVFFVRRSALVILLIAFCAATTNSQNNVVRSPSDTVREFYKAMREHRFKDAWGMTIYKPAVESLTPVEMEDLRPDFEDRAAKIPEQVEIVNEQITGNIAVV